MSREVPSATIDALARSIIREATAYGFDQIDVVRLVNKILDTCADGTSSGDSDSSVRSAATEPNCADSLPLKGERILIRACDNGDDLGLVNSWLPEKYGRFFVLSCANARSDSIDELIADDNNHFGIITLPDGTPIGALAFLDHSETQRRAELRKLIGDPAHRGTGVAEEATRLWIAYGFQCLGLEKIYVSTLQTHLSNIRLNERIGFKVEGLLRNEVLIDDVRHDVLRMGICRE